MATAIYSPYKANEGGVTYPRDASFSSYLDTSERDFVRSLAESVSSPSYIRENFSPRKSVGKNVYRVQGSGELGVFRAERYFKEIIGEEIKCCPLLGEEIKCCPLLRNYYRGDESYARYKHHKKEIRDDLLESKSSRSNVSTTSSNLKSPTPSLKSEGSFNSQFGLLLPKIGNVGHKIFSNFQCKGSCFDKKATFITNKQQLVQSSFLKRYQGGNDIGSRKGRFSKKEPFAFPIIDTATFSLKQDQTRNSMDVFEFHQLKKLELAHNDLEKKLSILKWDAIPNTTSNSFPFQSTNKTSPSSSVRTCQDDEDACSDASSDLFEIENLSGVRGSQTSSTPCYEPSEGSIEWSMVTASAADHISTFSDREDDYKSAITIEKRKVHKSSNSGIFLFGCTNHKAVDVVGH